VELALVMQHGNSGSLWQMLRRAREALRQPRPAVGAAASPVQLFTWQWERRLEVRPS
jgi:hypothetical protein